MSSERKDARWQLAHGISELLGRDWYGMQYGEHEVLLDAADDILNQGEYFSYLIPKLSKQWNSNE